MVQGEDDLGSKGVLKIGYTNVDGLVSGKLELSDYLKREKPDFMCIVETKLNSAMDIGGMFETYSVHRRDRIGKYGGGVMILVHKGAKITHIHAGEGRSETLALTLGVGKKRRTIAVAYIPPKTGSWSTEEHKEMLKDTQTSLETIMKQRTELILVGDFNCKEVDWENWQTEGSGNTWGSVLLDMAMENLLIQWVKETTRFRGDDQPSRLDLVFTKGIEILDKMVYKNPLGKSDHALIEFEIYDIKKRGEEGTRIEGKFDYGKADLGKMNIFFSRVDWNNLLSEINLQKKYDVFMDVYEEAVKRYVPKYKRGHPGKQVWFNRKCERARGIKERAWNKLRRRNSAKAKEEYRYARNEYVRVRRHEEREYERNIVTKFKRDPKLFFKFVNGKMKHKIGVDLIKSNGRVFEDPEEICQVMNEKFLSVFSEESYFVNQPKKEGTDVISDIPVGLEEIQQRLNKLGIRKSVGPDGIAGYILKGCRENLALPILDIVQCSLKEGNVPEQWKQANVIPVYKGGNKDDPLNYRPISLTSVFCKLVEGIIKDRWVQYLEKSKKICEAQYGFRKGRSCVSNLLSFYTRIIEDVQERNGWVDTIYLDLKKAFDKVPHRRLLWKIEHEGGIKGKLLEWMKNYLIGRKMRTVVKGEASTWGLIKSGVPQGSVLGPIMFLVYINDMVEGVKSYISLFADDAKIQRRVENCSNCQELQNDLHSIFRWSVKWEMPFNVNKCHVMKFGRGKRRPSWVYMLGDNELKKGVGKKRFGSCLP